MVSTSRLSVYKEGCDVCAYVDVSESEDDSQEVTAQNSFPSPSITHCPACTNNQTNNTSSKLNRMTMSRRKVNPRRGKRSSYIFIKGAMTTVPLLSVLSVILFLWMNLFVGFTEGLQCYECLSLYCDSGAVCDAIKNTMVDIFVPKRHFIHFDPSDICPEEELPMNALRWANLSRECERSDSICLVSPIEVHTVVDGKKNGKKLENEFTLMTHGYLRGCASRRKLLEFPDTINVRIEFAGRNNESGNNSGKGGANSGNSVHNQITRSGNDGIMSSSPEQGGGGGAANGNNKKKSEIFYNMTSIGNGAAGINPNKKTYKDGYTISKIYSHVFYIDQGTKNATRCYADNCNDKVKFKRSGTSGMKMLKQSNSSVLFTLITSILLGFQ